MEQNENIPSYLVTVFIIPLVGTKKPPKKPAITKPNRFTNY